LKPFPIALGDPSSLAITHSERELLDHKTSKTTYKDPLRGVGACLKEANYYLTRKPRKARMKGS
jgi:hypothetical protein